MDPKYQDIIRRNLTTLVRRMNAILVAKHLNASRIITEEMREQIETEKTNFDRNRKLINIILHRGPRAFIGLKVALMKANQRDLSKLLAEKNSVLPEYEEKLSTAKPLVIDLDKQVIEDLSHDIQSTEERQRSEDPRCRICLDDSNELFLTVTPYKGDINIHIRHFNQYGDRYFATKKGVTFPLSRWLNFEALLSDIDDYLNSHGVEEQEMKWHVGGGVYVSINLNYYTVDIRHYWKPSDAPEPVPTKKGVTLNKGKFARLKDAMQKIHDHVPELENTQPCILDESHQNQMGMFDCSECTPFGYEPENDQWSLECNVGDL